LKHPWFKLTPEKLDEQNRANIQQADRRKRTMPIGKRSKSRAVVTNLGLEDIRE